MVHREENLDSESLYGHVLKKADSDDYDRLFMPLKKPNNFRPKFAVASSQSPPCCNTVCGGDVHQAEGLKALLQDADECWTHLWGCQYL